MGTYPYGSTRVPTHGITTHARQRSPVTRRRAKWEWDGAKWEKPKWDGPKWDGPKWEKPKWDWAEWDSG